MCLLHSGELLTTVTITGAVMTTVSDDNKREESSTHDVAVVDNTLIVARFGEKTVLFYEME